MSEPLRVDWIGLGVMGAPMCGHLLAAGQPEQALPLVLVGARQAFAQGDASRGQRLMEAHTRARRLVAQG